jgi:phosphate transport system substrate-binding protein
MRGRCRRERIVTAFALLVLMLIAPAQAQDVIGSNGIRGAGSSFAYPLISRWSREFRAFQARGGEYPTADGGLDDALSTTALDYQPTGSLAGIVSIKQRSVDFAAVDVPLDAAELKRSNLVQFPILMGGIVVAVNLPGVKSEQLRLSGAVLADIFSGSIKNWNDPAVAALNPHITLPSAAITVVHRTDGSGTTANFTGFLSAASNGWRTRFGSKLLIDWPVGVGARGNRGIAETIRRTGHSIGYLDYTQAHQASLTLVQLQNSGREFVSPNATSFRAAAAGTKWIGADGFNTPLDITASAQAYPIVTAVYVLIPSNTPGRRTDAVLDLFEWALEKGQNSAAALGYVPLPDVLVKQIESHWALTLRK